MLHSMRILGTPSVVWGDQEALHVIRRSDQYLSSIEDADRLRDLNPKQPRKLRVYVPLFVGTFFAAWAMCGCGRIFDLEESR
jgi:hypothetical protein